MTRAPPIPLYVRGRSCIEVSFNILLICDDIVHREMRFEGAGALDYYYSYHNTANTISSSSSSLFP